MKTIPYTQQTIEADDRLALLNCLDKDFLTRGPQVEAFEKEVAKYCSVPFAVAFNSGSSALEAASYAGNIQPSDRIITSPNTFVGTVSGALKRTQNLSFLDISLETGAPDFSQLSSLKRKSRLCLFPVHFSGIAQKVIKPFEDSLIIEDACQAFGSRYLSGEQVGSCPTSDMTVFSFHPAKTICTGEGGLVTTKNPHLYQKLLLFRNNGIIRKKEDDPGIYEVNDLTSNYHLTEFQAALGLNQLKKIDRFLSQRRTCIERYRHHLKNFKNIRLLSQSYDATSAHNLFVVQIDFEELNWNRVDLMKKMQQLGISTQVHFIPLYKHPYFKRNFSIPENNYPHTEAYYKRALSLPLFSHLELHKVDTICHQFLNCLEKNCPALY